MELGPIQKQWINILRTQPERQLAYQLGLKTPEGEEKMCCLGQLALCAGVGSWENGTYKINDDFSGIPNYSDLGLNSNCGAIKNINLTLAELNDGNTSWPEIADIVERNLENIFNKSF